MKKCPYCGKENADNSVNCEKCFAGFPEEQPKEKAPKAEKKPDKEMNPNGT